MFTPWNLNRSPVFPSRGILASLSRRSLCHEAKSIPLGCTPWNESGAMEHLPFRSFAIRLAQNLYHRGDVIPPGIYIFFKRFSKAPSTHKEGGAFSFLTLGPERLSSRIYLFRSGLNGEC